jgi:putative lipoic acid-binding regulatory protein
MDTNESPLQFPCEFPVKAMGPAGATFEATVWGIVIHHAPDTASTAFSVTPSRQGTYISVTITITATSREQLDAIYADLQDEPSVMAVL